MLWRSHNNNIIKYTTIDPILDNKLTFAASCELEPSLISILFKNNIEFVQYPVKLNDNNNRGIDLHYNPF